MVRSPRTTSWVPVTRVSIGLTRSEYQSRYNFGYVDPYWTADGVSLGYNAFYRTTDYKDLDVDVASYAVDSLGAGVNVGYPISETSRLDLRPDGSTGQDQDRSVHR